MCSGFAGDGSRYTGYVTVDAVTECNAPRPFEAGFDVALDTRNVLVGTASVLDLENNASFGYAAVALEAQGAGELDGSPGFHGVSANAREPLPAAWQLDRNSLGPTERREFIVWRGSSLARNPFDCSTGPAWFPLTLANSTGYGSRGVFHVDDAGQASFASNRTPFPQATQRVRADATFPELADSSGGYTYVNLQHASGTQGWAATLSTELGRYQTLSVGRPIGDACDTAAFDNTSTGPDDTQP